MASVSLRHTAELDDGNIGGVFYQYTDPAYSGWYIAGIDSEGYSTCLGVIRDEFLVLRGEVNASGQKMTSLSVTVPIKDGNPYSAGSQKSANATIYAYLYDTDKLPHTGTTPPSGMIGSDVKSLVVQKQMSATNVTFTFNNIEVSGRYFYVWFTSNLPSSATTYPGIFIENKTKAYQDSCTGTFENLPPAIDWQTNSGTTDSSVYLSVRVRGENTDGVTARVKYGSTVLDTTTVPPGAIGVTANYTPANLKNFFAVAGVTTLKTITLTAVADSDASTAKTFTLTAGENMKPSAGSPSVTIVQPTSIEEDFPNTWIAGISKAKVTASAAAGSNAPIHTVVLNYGSESVEMTKNETTGLYEVTTSKPVTGDVTFTVVVTDTRGMEARSTYSLTGVQAYTKPIATIDSAATYRCDASGNKKDGGPYVRVKATAKVDTGISGNALQELYFYIGSTHCDLTSGVQSEPVSLPNPSEYFAVTVTVVVKDNISAGNNVKITLPGARKDIIVKRDGNRTNVGIGHVPTEAASVTGSLVTCVDIEDGGGYFIDGRNVTNFTSVDLYVMNDTLAQRRKWDSDFLKVDFTNPTGFFNENAEFTIAPANWTNVPTAVAGASEFSGVRSVIVGKQWIFVSVIERAPVSGRIWVNMRYRSESTSYSWQGWKGHTPDIT